MKRSKKIIAGAVAVVGLLALAPAAASAHVGPARRLRFGSSDTGSIHWQRHVSDSPLDANQARLKVAVDQDGDDWAYAYAKGTGVRGPVSKPRHLSFDVRTTGYVGAGAPRISVELDTDADGEADVYAYLSAAHCSKPITGSTWALADFTGHTGAGCALYASDQGLPYESSDGQSAWDTFAAAHEGARVLDAYLVSDETGQSFVDRLTIGQHVFGSASGAPSHA